MSISADIVSFLKRTPEIARLNFAFGKLKVYPSGYQTDVADAISSGKIKVKADSGAVGAGAGAAYFTDYDTLELLPGFSIAKQRDQAFVVHECTHAFFDLLSIGNHSGHDDEAAAYIAEAIYLEAIGAPPASGHLIRVAAHAIAKKVLAGAYAVSAADMATLSSFVGSTPIYSGKSTYVSDGTDNRPAYRNLVR